MYYNPALGAKQTDHSILVGTSIPGYDQQVFYAYAHIPKWYRGATFYLGFVSYQMTGIELRSYRTDVPDSVMNATQMMISGGLSRLLKPEISFGLDANIVFDNYTTTGVYFLIGAGLAWFPSNDILFGLSGKYLGDGQVLSSLGCQWRLVPDWKISSQLDAGIGGDFLSAQMKYGLEYSVSETTSIQLGYHSQMISAGLRQSFDSLGFELSYTNTPLGVRYSVGLELL